MTDTNGKVTFGPFRASVNVAQLLKEPIGATRSYDIADLVDANGETGVTGRVDMVRSLRGILVRAHLTTHVELDCSRCLSPTSCPVTFSIEEEFFPTIDVTSGLPVGVPDEDSGFTIDHNHILDLSEAVRQYAVLAAPMKPLCRPDCAGICPGCGTDLNQGKCSCTETTTDPRWAQLAALKVKTRRNPAPRKRATKPRERK